MELVGKKVIWVCDTERPRQLVYDVETVRTFAGVEYALLVWAARNKPDGTPQCRLVKAETIRKFYREVKR